MGLGSSDNRWGVNSSLPALHYHPFLIIIIIIMDGVKVALNSREATVEAADNGDKEKWTALMHM